MEVEIKSPMMLMFNKKGELYLKRDDLVNALDDVAAGAIKTLENKQYDPEAVIRGVISEIKTALNNITA